ncbi:MAG: hypothetical protein OIF57_17620 [Marinobacterium sp.]|nr:hypothetical protein [Marinobacterium sp.]
MQHTHQWSRPSRPGASHSVLFICRDNAICSPLAAAWLYRLTGGRIQARTAGIVPVAIPVSVQQRVAQLQRRPVALKPVAMRKLAGQTFDSIITLADRQECPLPVHPYDGEGVVWHFDRPVTAAQLRQLEFELMERLLLWLEVKRLRTA